MRYLRVVLCVPVALFLSSQFVGAQALPERPPITPRTPTPLPSAPETNSLAARLPGETESKFVPVSTPLSAAAAPYCAIPGVQSLTLREAVLIANGQAIDNRIADMQIEFASAAYLRARVLWLPNLNFGSDYYYHTGPYQNLSGVISADTRQTFMYGAGFNAIVATNDAVYAPRAARNVLGARHADRIAVGNDVAVDVTEAYFQALQYQSELAALQLLVIQGEQFVREVVAMGEGLVPDVEINRAKVELARRKQVVVTVEERYRIAVADLVRVIRLEPGTQVNLTEPPDFKAHVVDQSLPLTALIQTALVNRPELVSRSSLVRAANERLKQEKMRPLMPSVLLRSVSTQTNGTLGMGSFGGGNFNLSNFGSRADYDVQLLWELQNLGFGNRAIIRQRGAENEIARLELYRAQDQVGADVSQAYASVLSAAERLAIATPAYEEAKANLKKNIEGLPQTKRVGNLLVLIIRPQEVVSAFQAMNQAISDYYGALADYNRAEFRLNRALGNNLNAFLNQPN